MSTIVGATLRAFTPFALLGSQTFNLATITRIEWKRTSEGVINGAVVWHGTVQTGLQKPDAEALFAALHPPEPAQEITTVEPAGTAEGEGDQAGAVEIEAGETTDHEHAPSENGAARKKKSK